MITDQQMAGAIMKVGGTMLLWSIILVVFFQWYGVEERADRAERKAMVAQSWAEAEAQVAAAAAPLGVPARRTRVMPDVLTWEHVVSELAKSQPASARATRRTGAVVARSSP